MKQILYEDNNNNAKYLMNILAQVQQQVETVIFWKLSCFDFVIVDIGDFFNGIISPEIEEVYNFGKKIEREHVIMVEHNYLIKMLKNIRTVYYANMKTVIGNDVFSIKIQAPQVMAFRHPQGLLLSSYDSLSLTVLFIGIPYFISVLKVHIALNIHSF